MDKILVASAGVGLIALIYWFFFGKKSSEAPVNASGGVVDVIVDGGYRPQNIKVKRGETTKIVLERRDPNTCLEEIIIPDFKISKYLPLDKKTVINITPSKDGVFPFHCGMNMFHGKVIVEK